MFFLTFLCRAKPKREHIACCLREQACYWVDGLTADSFLHMGLLEDFNKLALFEFDELLLENLRKRFTLLMTRTVPTSGGGSSLSLHTDIQNRPLM